MLSGPTRPPATTGQFALSAPADQAMVTTTRRPALSWAAVGGAVRYQVWINISRTDYDFTQPGNLIDLYTKVAELDRHELHADLGPARPVDLQVVHRLGQRIRRHHHVEHPHVQRLPAHAGDAWPTASNIVDGSRDLNRNGAIEPYEDWRQPVETRVNDLLGRMTLQEKAYQMFYNAQVFPQSGWHFGPAEAPDLHPMLLASSGTRLGIPFVSAGDTIHGYKTTYPTQSALAAARDYPLVYKLGDMQRREQLEVGTRGVLGPLAEVGTKVLYPRIQEGNGENADVAAAQVRALVSGLQGGPELNPRLGPGHGQALAGRGRRRRGAHRVRRGHHQVPHDPVPGGDGGRRGQHHARATPAARSSTRAARAPVTARRSWPTCARTSATPASSPPTGCRRAPGSARPTPAPT